MNTPSSSTSVKPRWGMRILFGFFAALTILGILASFADARNLPGVCFFGVLAAMFFVMAKSPKDKPCIFGREQGTKKSVFVIGCVAAAFVLMVIAAPPQESNATPTKSESATAAPIEQPAEPPAPQQAAPTPTPPAAPQPHPEEKPAPAPVELICDLEQFGGMTERELEAVMGQPSEVASDTYGQLEIPCKVYRYKNAGEMGQTEFTFARGVIVKLVCLKVDGFPCPDRGGILERLGIKKWALCIKGTDSPHALSFKQPSKKVDEIWLTLFNGDKFKSITVTYTAER